MCVTCRDHGFLCRVLVSLGDISIEDSETHRVAVIDVMTDLGKSYGTFANDARQLDAEEINVAAGLLDIPISSVQLDVR